MRLARHVRLAALSALLGCAALASTMVQAQEQQGDLLDKVVAILIGFEDGATVEVGRREVATVTRDAAGAFSGTTPSGADFSFVVTQPTMCQFEARFEMDGEVFGLSIDATQLEQVSFEPDGAEDGYQMVRVRLDGPEGFMTAVRPDGQPSAVTHQSRMGTSIPLANLEAAGAALLESCAGD